MPSNHLILCHPLLLQPSIFPTIRVFSNESVLGIRWPKYWSFSFSISPSSEYSGLISFRIDWSDLLMRLLNILNKIGININNIGILKTIPMKWEHYIQWNPNLALLWRFFFFFFFQMWLPSIIGLPWWLRRWSVCLKCGRPKFNPRVGKIPWRRKWQPTPVLLPGKAHGWRSLVGYSSWGRRVGHDRATSLPSLLPPSIISWLYIKDIFLSNLGES